jgi:diguanylate cyclase (GGDEF)-like protein
MRDLSDRKRSEAQIRHMAHHDTLTNLPSRPLLSERLNTVIKTASVKGAGAAVLYLDLDRFKPVNDILGHAGGDAVLIEVARRLQAQTRSTDAVARLGGDEFVMVVGNVSTPDEIRNLAFRLIKTIEQPFDVEGRQIGIGVSIGAAIYPRDGNDPETLLRAADMAMYRAKSNGRGNVEFFDSRMDTRLRERRKLEQELRLAVERGEMMLHYQPLVDCRSGQINGFEALLRWNHPVHGIMNAGQFIPLAEETGVIGQLDSWAIEHACIEASGWAIPLNLAVNVSTSEFRQADWPRNVAAALTRSGLDPARLEIEVTESVLIQDPDRAVKTLSQLRDFGARLSLDDFGTGYSSLNYLRLFRFDKFKIDRSFANDLGRGTEAATIISAIINLGHTLGLSVTVEGIETADQLAQIVALGADQVQGYLLGRPGFVEDFKGAAMTQLWQFGEPSRTLVTSHG